MARFNYIVTIIGITLLCVFAEEMYSDKYDNIDVESIIQNDTLRSQYIDCFMDTSPCLTDSAKYFKGIFSEVITTKCQKCTEKQKQNLDFALDWFTKNKPEEWKALNAKSIEIQKKKNAD